MARSAWSRTAQDAVEADHPTQPPPLPERVIRCDRWARRIGLTLLLLFVGLAIAMTIWPDFSFSF